MRLNDEQRMLQDYAQRLLAEQGPVANLRQLRDTNQSYDAPLWQAMIDAGWGGLLIEEQYGGLDFGHVGAGLIAYEIGQNLSVTPFYSTLVLAANALKRGGTTTQKETWLNKIVAGSAIFALAIDEGPKHHPEQLQTQAVEAAGQWQLNGEKTFVLDGSIADMLLVAATSNEATQLFLVDASAQGVTIEKTAMVDSGDAARIQFNQAVAEPLADGNSALNAVLLSARSMAAAELAGLAHSALQRTLDYLRERKQFGVHIGSFQALQHRAAHLFSEVAMADALAMQALAAIDADSDDALLLSYASKAKANRVARLAVSEAVQMHGGIGMTDEFDIGFYMKRARVLIETFGDTNYCQRQFATLQDY